MLRMSAKAQFLLILNILVVINLNMSLNSSIKLYFISIFDSNINGIKEGNKLLKQILKESVILFIIVLELIKIIVIKIKNSINIIFFINIIYSSIWQKLKNMYNNSNWKGIFYEKTRK